MKKQVESMKLNSDKKYDISTLRALLKQYIPVEEAMIDEMIDNFKRADLDNEDNIALICHAALSPEFNKRQLFSLMNDRIDQYMKDTCFTYLYLDNVVKAAGSIVGETALQSKTSRTATIIALEKTTVLTLDKKDFMLCLGSTMKNSMMKFEFFTDKFPFISKRILMNFSYLFEDLVFKRGDPLTIQGMDGDCLYLIEEGTVGLFLYPKEEIHRVSQRNVDLTSQYRVTF